jgi:hypothetical protein
LNCDDQLSSGRYPTKESISGAHEPFVHMIYILNHGHASQIYRSPTPLSSYTEYFTKNISYHPYPSMFFSKSPSLTEPPPPPHRHRFAATTSSPTTPSPSRPSSVRAAGSPSKQGVAYDVPCVLFIYLGSNSTIDLVQIAVIAEKKIRRTGAETEIKKICVV